MAELITYNIAVFGEITPGSVLKETKRGPVYVSFFDANNIELPFDTHGIIYIDKKIDPLNPPQLPYICMTTTGIKNVVETAVMTILKRIDPKLL